MMITTKHCEEILYTQINLIPLLNTTMLEDLRLTPNLMDLTKNEFQVHIERLREKPKEYWSKTFTAILGLSMTLGFARLKEFSSMVLQNSNDQDPNHLCRVFDQLEIMVKRTLEEANYFLKHRPEHTRLVTFDYDYYHAAADDDIALSTYRATIAI